MWGVYVVLLSRGSLVRIHHGSFPLTVASAPYGSSALGSVVNLVSRRPKQSEHEFLLNRTSRGGNDAVIWLAQPRRTGWRLTLLGGSHAQRKGDVDSDGWADLPGYRRGTHFVLV